MCLAWSVPDSIFENTGKSDLGLFYRAVSRRYPMETLPACQYAALCGRL